MVETAEAVAEEQDQQADASQTDSKTKVQPAEFPDAGEDGPKGAPGSIDILLDMDVPIIASIGQAEISVRQLLQLGPGSVLKLEQSIDEPADLYLKGAKFASGTVVVVDNRFAIRIEQILGAENGSDA